jgi:hypothetical protein
VQKNFGAVSFGALALKTVVFVFVTGSTWLDSLVTTVTRSRWSHVALRFETENLLVEALVGKGLILQPGHKYDAWPTRVEIPRTVPPAAYAEMLALARRWAGGNIPYGYRTCAAIGLKELFGRKAGGWALDHLPGKTSITLVCSELIVNLWRITAPDFFAGWEPRLVSPDELYRVLNEGSAERAN